MTAIISRIRAARQQKRLAELKDRITARRQAQERDAAIAAAWDKVTEWPRG